MQNEGAVFKRLMGGNFVSWKNLFFRPIGARNEPPVMRIVNWDTILYTITIICISPINTQRGDEMMFCLRRGRNHSFLVRTYVYTIYSLMSIIALEQTMAAVIMWPSVLITAGQRGYKAG